MSRWRAASLVLSALCMFLPSPSAGQVLRDGTIGAAGPGSVATQANAGAGLDYLIGEADGELFGANLFHSFGTFDLGAGDRAVYQGAPTIRNLITRVTGGRSVIDGVIRSEIPGANLYFLNPAGVVFGENAEIDVMGAFAVSTSQRLLFEGGDVFEVLDMSTPNLSIADVAGFGFIEAPADVQILGSQIEIALDQSLALIGGDIEIRGTTPSGTPRSDGQPGIVAVRSGRLDIASVRSSGEVYLDVDVTNDGIGDGVLRVENVTERGDITISDNVSVSTSGLDLNPFNGVNEAPGEGSGPINIFGGNLLIEDGDLRTDTVTSEDGGDITIDLNGDFVARSLAAGLESGIVAGTGLRISPQPGEVVTQLLIATYPTAEVRASVCGNVVCGIFYEGSGRAGGVEIEARNVILEDGGRVTARSVGTGDAGTVDLSVTDSVQIRGVDVRGRRSRLSSTTENLGRPGNISIQSPGADLILEDFGAIVIENSELANAQGPGGLIDIDVARIDMRGNARIDSSTRGGGVGGTIDVNATESIRLSGRLNTEEFTGITTLSQPGSTGSAGNIHVETPYFDLSDGAAIAARPVAGGGLGDAGNLDFVIADQMRLRDATINAETDSAGGGNITAFVGNLLDLQNSTLSTSVVMGSESGGNVTIQSEPGSAVILENSQIIAQADAGTGGNILVETGFLLEDPSSLIDASSNSGFDGVVIRRAPDDQVVDQVQSLETPPIDASALLSDPCSARQPGSGNSLVVAQLAGFPLNAEAYLPAFLPDSAYQRLDEAAVQDIGGGAAQGQPANALPRAAAWRPLEPCG